MSAGSGHLPTADQSLTRSPGGSVVWWKELGLWEAGGEVSTWSPAVSWACVVRNHPSLSRACLP